MVDFTQEQNDSNILIHDFGGSTAEMHAGDDVLNFLRFFACNFQPLPKAL